MKNKIDQASNQVILHCFYSTIPIFVCVYNSGKKIPCAQFQCPSKKTVRLFVFLNPLSLKTFSATMISYCIFNTNTPFDVINCSTLASVCNSMAANF